MKVEQISIFIENKSGRLAEVSGVLGLIVDDSEKALNVLREGHFTVNKTEVIGVEVPDSPGGLSSILKILDNNQINVEYMYAFVERSGSNAVIIFRFDNIDQAIKVLLNNGVNILDGEKITSI